MRCPFCGEQEDKVIDSRPSKDGKAVRRRRECVGCGRRFTTYEYVEEIALQVRKADGRLEPFDRNKLLGGLKIASTKRPVSMEQLDRLAHEVEESLYVVAEKEVSSRQIGDLVMQGLKRLDPVAYIRYASVYRRFEDVGAFTEEVRRLQ